MERPHLVEAGSLEVSLLQMINDHNHGSIEIRDRTDRAKKEAIRNAARVSDLLVNAVDGGVQEVFLNEERVEMEIRSVAATVTRFSKQTEQWLAASRAVNNAVKALYLTDVGSKNFEPRTIRDSSELYYHMEIGDFENWMKTMELDCRSITAAICNIHQS